MENLKNLQDDQYMRVSHIIDTGIYNSEHAHDWRFSIVKKLGIGFKELCSNRNNKFFIEDILKLGIEMIKAVQNLHSLGYVHQNIKESSFFLDYD
jgi:serine/threonine protein kinase